MTAEALTCRRSRFANANDGFAFDPGLWTTINGGASWTDQQSLGELKHFTVLSLTATSNGTVYVLAARKNPSTDGSVGRQFVFRAAADSTPFSQVARVPVSGVAAKLVAAGPSVYLVSGNGDLLSFGPVGERSVKLPDTSAGSGCQIAASSQTSLLAICGGSVASGAMGAREAFGTTDGGRHWTRLANPGKGLGYATSGVAETANGHAVIVAGDAAEVGLLTTVDHAQRWRTTLSYTGTDGVSFSDLGFENDLDGSVIYNPATNGLNVKPRPTGILLRTSDGGASWHRVRY